MTDWRGWLITDEQAELIRGGDIPARNAFYFDNLARIKGMAYNYAYKTPRCRGYGVDMVSCLYVDLGYFRQDNGKPVVDGLSLSRFVVASFRYCLYGGLLYLSENNPKLLSGGGLAVYAADCLSLDKPFGGMQNAKRHQDDKNACTLGEVVPAPDMLEGLGFVDHTDDLKAVVADLLSPRENVYFGLFIEGYGNAEISRRLGYKGSNCAPRVREKLRKNCSLILSRLAALGVSVDGYENKAPYNPKTDKVYKLSPERRARAAELKRIREAKKRALLSATSI